MDNILNQFEVIAESICTCDHLMAHNRCANLLSGVAYSRFVNQTAKAIIEYNTLQFEENISEENSHLLAGTVIYLIELLSQIFDRDIECVEDDLQLSIEKMPLTELDDQIEPVSLH